MKNRDLPATLRRENAVTARKRTDDSMLGGKPGSSGDSGPPAKHRVLIIDDDKFIRELARYALERGGFEVVEAPDGEAGIQCHLEAPADIVVTDILMPEKEGLETILQFRRDDPTIRIIAISGGVQTGVVDFLSIARKLGADMVLPKPFRPSALVRMVRELLSTK